MPLFYPHKQTAIIFLVCILGVLATVWYVGTGRVRNQGVDSLADKQGLQVTQSTEAFSTTTDWQKQFFVQSTTTIPQSKTLAVNDQSPNEPETVTDKFGKKFFEQFMLLKQNDLIDDPDAVKAVVDQNMNDIVDSAPEARVYDIRNVLLSPNIGILAEKTYANSVGEILTLYMPQNDAAIIATQALEKNDPSRINEIQAVTGSYSTVLKKLLEVPAPKSLADELLALINSMSAMVFISEGMSKVFSDPLQSMVSLAVYEKSLVSLQNALLDLKFAFNDDQVVFSSTDSGNVFNLIN